MACDAWVGLRRDCSELRKFPLVSLGGLKLSSTEGTGMYIDKYRHTHTHTHTYIYTYILHTHTHTHIYISVYIHTYICGFSLGGS